MEPRLALFELATSTRRDTIIILGNRTEEREGKRRERKEEKRKGEKRKRRKKKRKEGEEKEKEESKGNKDCLIPIYIARFTLPDSNLHRLNPNLQDWDSNLHWLNPNLQG